jgi:hypothetical protein
MAPLISTWPYLASLAFSMLCTTLLGGQSGVGLAPLGLLLLGFSPVRRFFCICWR